MTVASAAVPVTQKPLSGPRLARPAAGTALLVSGVTNEAVQAALDVGHLLQHVVDAGFIQLQTHELRVLAETQRDVWT